MSDDSDSEAEVAEAWSRLGREWFDYVTTKPDTGPDTPFFRAGVRDFVFAEIWSRPGLDTRTRRWIALSCAAANAEGLPVRSHIYSALKSGDISLAEMHEFTLHFAVYSGWPKAAALDSMIIETWQRIAAEGGPVKRSPPESRA